MTKLIQGGLLLWLVLGASTGARATDFETTAEGMLNKLTAPPSATSAKRRTRSAPGKTRSARPARGLKRVKTAQGDLRIEDLPSTTASVNVKIEFDVDSYAIRPDSLFLLDELGRALLDSRLTGRQFIVGGHTDADGTVDYNLELSLNRAKAVKQYLVRHFSIGAARLHVVGYGETTPLKSNTTPQNKQYNRRVEVLRIGAE